MMLRKREFTPESGNVDNYVTCTVVYCMSMYSN